MSSKTFIHTAEIRYRLTYKNKQALKQLFHPRIVTQGDKQRWLYSLQINDAIYAFFYLDDNMMLYVKATFKKMNENSPEANIEYLYSCLEQTLSEYIDFDVRKATLSRIDFAIDIVMDENLRKTYLDLLNHRGYKKYWGKENGDYETSHYFRSQTIRINLYDKKPEAISSALKKNEAIQDLTKYEFLRVEIQCLNRHLDYRKSACGWPKCLEFYYSTDMLTYFFDRVLKNIILPGDHYEMETVKHLLKENYSKHHMNERLENFIKDINRYGFDEIKANNQSRWYSYLSRLESIGVHPILLTNSTYACLPNLYSSALKTLYDDNYNIMHEVVYNEEKE